MFFISAAPLNIGFSRRLRSVGTAVRSTAANISGVGGGSAFIVFTVFLAGAVCGVMFQGLIPEDICSSDLLSSILEVYISADNTGFQAFFYAVMFHAAVFFLCFSMFGVFLIPATVFFRGFTAAFSVTSVVGLYASHGALLAASVFGVSAVFSIPGFLILSVVSLGVSRRLFTSVARGEASRVFGAEYFMITAACFAVSVIPALYRIYLLPGIVSNLL